MKSLLRKFRAVSLTIPLCACLATTQASAFESPPPEIVSAWKFNDANIVLIFRYDGSFYFIDGEEDSPPGLEFGTFEWDKETGDFSVEIAIDSNTDAGFSDPEGATSISVTGDTLTYTIAGEGSFPFTRVVNTANPIVGSWYVNDPSKANLTFLADGTYYHSEPGENSGIELGTYTWNQNTKALTATQIIDTNDDIGLSNPEPSFTANITGDTMELNDGREEYTLRRVVTNPTPFDLPEFGVLRFANHIQTSANTPALRSIADDFPYSADAFVDGSVGASAPTVQIGAGTPIPIDPDFPDGFDSQQGFADLTSLDSFLPASTAIQFKDGAGVANLTTSPTGSFPSIPQIISGDAGAWSGGAYDFVGNEVLEWNLPDGFDTTQYLTVLEIEDTDTGEEVVTAYLQGPVRDFDLSGKLQPGREYEAQLEFFRMDSATTSGTGIFAGKNGQAASSRSTIFTMKSGGIDQEVRLIAVSKRKLADQQAPGLLAETGALFAAVLEGEGLSSTFPSSSINLRKPDTTTVPFAFLDGEWETDTDFADLPALQSVFPDGRYHVDIGANSVPIDMFAAAYPNQPLITPSVGTWADGKLEITASQVAAGFTLTTNTSTGNGFVTINVIDSNDNDIVIAEANTNGAGPFSVSASISPSLLSVGQTYEVEAEFDQVIDVTPLDGQPWAAPGANAFGVLSSTTVLLIEVVPDPVQISYNDWQTGFFDQDQLDNPAISGDDVDFDGDGVPNLIEFILGNSPSSTNPNPINSATLAEEESGPALVFFYDRKTSTNSISQVIETSVSLDGVWKPAIHGVDGVVITTIRLDAGTQRVTATIPSTEPKLFVRLKASR